LAEWNFQTIEGRMTVFAACGCILRVLEGTLFIRLLIITIESQARYLALPHGAERLGSCNVHCGNRLQEVLT